MAILREIRRERERRGWGFYRGGVGHGPDGDSVRDRKGKREGSWAVGRFGGWAERLLVACFLFFLFFCFSFSDFLFVS
jgi:hypothetical protein